MRGPVRVRSVLQLPLIVEWSSSEPSRLCRHLRNRRSRLGSQALFGTSNPLACSLRLSVLRESHPLGYFSLATFLQFLPRLPLTWGPAIEQTQPPRKAVRCDDLNIFKE